jgi:GT2 family glycosyltransferase
MERAGLEAGRQIDVIIPFYRNAALIGPLFDSLRRISDEFTPLHTIVAINDSPDDGKLEEELSSEVERLSHVASCTLVRNERNLGFVRSANRGLSAAREAGHDAILLNSDTVIFPGAISELERIAYIDPMTGFVSPRSNNATICSLPCQQEFRHLSPEESYANFVAISKYLPDFHYVPTAVGFCLYIKSAILQEFGIFDDVYGLGYNEENDLIMRANRCGFRAVLANHAFVHHVGEASFSNESKHEELQKNTADILQKRYPEYVGAIGRYFASAHYRGEEMLTALLPDGQGRLDLVFDFSSVGPYHNGTFDAGRRLLQAAVKHWRGRFNIHVMVSGEARAFHKLDEVPHVYFVSPETDRAFAVALRFGQPFEEQQLVRMSRTGILNVFGMLDTIALDCQYLHHSDLELIWGCVCQYASGIIYISDFVREQFRRRFRFGKRVRELVAYLSLDLRDYSNGSQPNGSGDYILVIGNSFEHKRVPATVEALNRAFPRVKTLALGINAAKGQNVIAYPSGNLSEASMHNLLCDARFVVYPSTYEGFGIPVLEALACGKPVMARSIPVMQAIRESLPARDNLILYDSTDELVRRLRDGFPEWKPVQNGASNAHVHDWSAIGRKIGTFLEGLLEDWSFSEDLLPRLEYVPLLEASGPTRATADRNELDACQARVNDLEASLSWRITAPLRWIGGIWLKNT